MANINFKLRNPYKQGKTKEVAAAKKSHKRLDKYFNSDQTNVIIVFGIDRDNRFGLKTDLNIKAKDWDFKKQQMKSNSMGSMVFNDRLSNLHDGVTNYYNELMNGNPDITFNQVKERITEYVTGKQKPDLEQGTSFFDVFDLYVEANKTKVTHRTIQKYNTLKKSLLAFTSTKTKYKNISFSMVDLAFYDAYRNYLLSEVKNPKTGKKGLLNDTVSKYIENLKNFLKWSSSRGYHSNMVFTNNDFSAKRKPKQDIVTLDFEELRTLYNFDFSYSKRLDQARDLFCFACFTGQRWADIEAFNKNDVQGDTWTFKAKKTGKTTTIPFLGYIAPSYDILVKYSFELPQISNQKFNDYIKEAAAIAGLNRMVTIERLQGVTTIETSKPLHKFISMHTGRRTAVSLLLNVEKMPIPQVMDITQHTDFKTLRKYINEDKDALRANLLKTRNVANIGMKVIKGKAQ